MVIANGRISIRVVWFDANADVYHIVRSLAASAFVAPGPIFGPANATRALGNRDSAKEFSVALSRLVVYPLSVVLIISLVGRAVAVPPTELLFPVTTKGFISTQDVDEVRNAFNKTQFGEMAHDPVMKQFIDDLKKQ